MLTLIAGLLAAAQPAPAPAPGAPGGTAEIFATVSHSEWCPAGNVRLDLRTGRYAFTARAAPRVCNNAGLERPVSTGSLGGRQLAALQAAYGRANTEGLANPACSDGARSQGMVVSNGGTPIVLLTNRISTRTAPDSLACWSQPARDLYQLLDADFGENRRR